MKNGDSFVPRKSSRLRSITSSRIPYRMKTLFAHNSSKEYMKSIPNNFEKVHNNPNIYVIRDFLTEGEHKHLLSIIEQKSKNFKNSYTESDTNEKVHSSERTSKYIFLKKQEDLIVRNIEKKASEIVGVFSENVEPLQIIRYQKGQSFTTHHDAGTLNIDTGNIELVYPRRIATLFVYLNDCPYGQGHTEFPDIHGLELLKKRFAPVVITKEKEACFYVSETSISIKNETEAFLCHESGLAVIKAVLDDMIDGIACNFETKTVEKDKNCISIQPTARHAVLFSNVYIPHDGDQSVEDEVDALDMSPSHNIGENKETIYPMWSEILEEGDIEPRTIHQACPITNDNCMKLGLNIWITDSNMNIREEFNTKKKRKFK